VSTRSRFLFAAWPFPGHVFPHVAIAHALRRRGHECAFYTGEQIAHVLRDEGFTVFPFRHVDEGRLDRLMRARPAEPWRLTSLPRLGALLRRWLLDTIPQQVRDLEETAAAFRPDVIASDPTLWAPMLVLSDKHTAKVAVCSFIPACPLPGPGVPPFGPGLPRPRGWRQSIVVEAARLSTTLSARVGRRVVNRIRRDNGLAPITVSPAEYTARMPLYLIPSAREFDYGRHDLPAHVHYVGPCVWNRPRAGSARSLLDWRRRDLPCVHVTEGTVHVQKPFVLRAAVTGLGGLPLQVIATTGLDRSPEDLGASTVAENVRVVRWVSHSDLLPHTDVMVTTGGAGSVLAALSAGVPLVIVPTEWDKPEIAQRVVEAGAGVRLAPRACTPERLRRAVERVLGEASFRGRARHLADVFGRLGGPERAAHLLEVLRGNAGAGPARERVEGAGGPIDVHVGTAYQSAGGTGT
jgi:MGT family glycosyltransferase